MLTENVRSCRFDATLTLLFYIYNYNLSKICVCVFNLLIIVFSFLIDYVNCRFSTTSRYTPEQQEALVSNVFLTGGNMQYPGMKERIERELLAMRPFQSHFKVEFTNNKNVTFNFQ